MVLSKIFSLALIFLLLTFTKAELLILNFHDLNANANNPSLDNLNVNSTGLSATFPLTAHELTARILTLQEQGYSFTTLLTKIVTSATKQVAITFDDGFASVYTVAFPVLKELSVPASVFVITSRIGKDNYLSWQQLQELIEAGWAIGSHTKNHADLTALTLASLRKELKESHDILAKHLTLTSNCLAYPFGRHNARVRLEVALWYDCALATSFGINETTTDPYAYHRPLPIPFGQTIFDLQQETGIDLRVLAFLPSLAYWFYPSKSASYGMPKAFYHPARFIMMGNGEIATEFSQGILYSSFFERSGAYALTGITSKFRESYLEMGGVVFTRPVAIGLSWSTNGLVGGVSILLGDYGEAWASLGLSKHFASGITIIPYNYILLEFEYRYARGISAEATVAAPILESEGYPIRGILGYSNSNPYAGLSAYVGGFNLKSTI